jgi:hypothetical protein
MPRHYVRRRRSRGHVGGEGFNLVHSDAQVVIDVNEMNPATGHTVRGKLGANDPRRRDRQSSGIRGP